MFDPFDVTGADFVGAVQVLRTLRPRDAMRVLKTWIHSWAASDRFHENPRLPCLFGCEGQLDKLAHYLLCPPPPL